MSKDQEIAELLNRGVAEINIREDLEKKLRSGKKLRIKFGIDPTGSELHIGHAVPLQKLAQFQKLGHTVILLIGDYTAKVGDPTGKSETRPMLTDEQIQENMKDYVDQAGKILDISKAEIRYNSEWFNEISMTEIIKIASTRTVSQILHRKDFRNRMEQDVDIALSELMYPIMQGYDSVALKADVEIGGTDQLFNLMVGRAVQKQYDQVPQDVLTVPILEGLDGVEKMSKSLDNYIGVTESSKEMFGKTMSIPDDMIIRYFELATTVSMEEIAEIKKQLESGENPRNLKVRLAKEIVTFYHDAKAADQAEEEFTRMFADKGKPDDMPQVSIPKGEYSVLDLVIKSKLCASNSDARRMIQSGAVKVDDVKKEDMEEMISVHKNIVLQVGKRKFCELVVS